MSETAKVAELVAQLRAMRPATDVNRLQLSRDHREDELGKLAYRRAINDALALVSSVFPPTPRD